MSPRRLLALLTTTLLLAMAGVANAQVDAPPPLNEIRNGRPWTYQFGKGILAGALLLVVAVVLGYLVKSRDFRANQKRGGSK